MSTKILAGAGRLDCRFSFLARFQQCDSTLAGDAQGGGSPLVGGAGSIDACQRVLLARCVLPASGDTLPPRLSPGETRKGDQIPCSRRPFLSSL
jgi:hypothetical protein